MTSTASPHIVVGVDGSDGSKDALRWAADYARRCGGRLHVVGAWHYPAMYAGYATPVTATDLGADMEHVVRATVTDVLGSEPDLTVDIRVEQGPPAHVLLMASRTADLLVVGSRGHGAFAGMLLGSVSTHCVHQAHCPVVVVRP